MKKNQEKLWGVAAAIQEKTYTVSVISGEQKDNIQIVSTYTDHHKNDFEAYQSALDDAIAYCREQQKNNFPLIIVEGCATGAKLSHLQQGTNEQIKSLVKKNIKQKFPEKTEVFPWEYTCSTGDSIQSDDEYLVIKTEQKKQGEIFNLLAEKRHPGITKKLKYEIHKYALGGYKDTSEIKPTIEDIANIIVDNYKQRRQMMGEQIGGFGFGKFSNISGPTDIRNMIFEYPELKAIYGKKLLSEMGNTDWNVCLKSAFDPHNPPFTDIAATFLGDIMDKQNNTQPGLVQIQPSPIIL